ncbi:methyltransferase domain-containing protein [Flavobacteriaceae bacterium TP-CH-4]|uniref:Methyltransferase domain-containing protein n=1 Tax=Pelagihabitans pacificus TaxID=2696054 RepID=A0A967EB86_9FLAO|nr:class I SAM-dependent methyltransferase [Pelagihabitans pacificus]NHF60121.1 methyltransferase domain-containing protein [Pelagihabitans pacificus]
MNDSNILDRPGIHPEIEKKSKEIGFTMPSDLYIGTLLRTLVASKPKARVLELGTGIGLSLSWMVDGMDNDSKLITIDNDPKLTGIAKQYFGSDGRVEIICADGDDWIEQYDDDSFDLIFADAWPGKYSQIKEVLDLVKVGGFYIIDDMNAQPNWPDGHQTNVDGLIHYLENRDDFTLTKLNWSTGLVIAVRNK